MPQSREAVARQAAQALLEEVDVSVLPVDPFEIAMKLTPPVRIIERELADDIFGACGLIQGRFVIVVSPACPTSGHRRFTAAHELGHYRIEGHVDQMFADGQDFVPSTGGHFQLGATGVEREADCFASELLMPESLVRPMIRGRPSLSLVKRLADRCHVSLSSAAITVARLSGEPLVVLVSKKGVLEWPAYSRAFSEYPWARPRVKGEWAPPQSATHRLARDLEAVSASKEDGTEGLLCEWYPGAPPFVTVDEEAIGLGAYGRVLTVLAPGPLPDPDEEQERSWRSQREDVDDEY